MISSSIMKIKKIKEITKGVDCKRGYGGMNYKILNVFDFFVFYAFTFCSFIFILLLIDHYLTWRFWLPNHDRFLFNKKILQIMHKSVKVSVVLCRIVLSNGSIIYRSTVRAQQLLNQRDDTESKIEAGQIKIFIKLQTPKSWSILLLFLPNNNHNHEF